MGKRYWAVMLVVLVFLSVLGCELVSLGDMALNQATPQVIVVTATPAPSLPTATPVPPTPMVVEKVVTTTPEPMPSLPPVTYPDVEEDLVIAVYERVGPAVVFITSEFYYYDYFFGRQTQSGSGSGFVIDRDGHIVTNNHVIDGANSVDVKFSTGLTVAAEIVGTDAYNDLAVLKVERTPEELVPVSLGQSSTLRVGQRAVAIGNPLGLEQSLSVGVISALNRQLATDSEFQALYDVIQTDAAINQGNSGGPLLDSQGNVIGVNTAIPNVTGASIGIGFAVSVDTVRRVVPELIAEGRYRHPWLGLDGLAVTPSLAELLDLPAEKGVLIMQVAPGGPAVRAGLRGPTREVVIYNRRVPVGGDIVVAIDDQPISDMDSINRYLETRKRFGDVVTVTVNRDGELLSFKVELGMLPT